MELLKAETVNEQVGDLISIDLCQLSSANNETLAVVSILQFFNLNHQLVLLVPFPRVSELLVKRQQSFYDLLNGCITWQEEHQITRELQ